MRGTDAASGSLFSYADLEAPIQAHHPQRWIRQVVNDALASLDANSRGFTRASGVPRLRRTG